MLDTALEKDIIELLASNLKTAQIEEMGRLIFGKFDVHTYLQASRHITIQPRRAAEALLQNCRSEDCYQKLIHLLVETDGSQLMGRQVSLDGIERLLENLTKLGVVYDFDKRRVISAKTDRSELANWGSLRDGRSYDVTVCSIDIVDNSKLVKQHGRRKVQKLYFGFRQLLTEKLKKYNGRIWTWNGDGGLVAFTFKEHEVRAVQFALELQKTLPVFNSVPEKGIDAEVSLRIGLDAGKLRFATNTGAIVSEIINFAAHLEKQVTPEGHVAVSDTVFAQLPPKLGAAFAVARQFEGRPVRLVPSRLDVMVNGAGHYAARIRPGGWLDTSMNRTAGS